MGDDPGLSTWVLIAITGILIRDSGRGRFNTNRREDPKRRWYGDGSERLEDAYFEIWSGVRRQVMPAATRTFKRQGIDSPLEPLE